jgi:transposase
MFGMEPTGHYWLNLAYFLKAKGYDVVLVNPMHVKNLKKIKVYRGRKLFKSKTYGNNQKPYVLL